VLFRSQDITERKVLEDRLEHRAYHDTLTDLPNRHLLVNRLAHALERTQRRWDRQAALLFMDLDGFKVVNDSLGHDAGDHLLVLVAERLRRCLRPEDTLARFGGDEFVVLLEDVEDPSEAVRVAERITNELKKPFVMDGRSLFASVSIGIAQGNARTKSPLDLLRDADTAMYRAKSEHADHRVFDPAMYERAMKRLELENDLRRGLEAQEFVVHYQPIVDLETGETWGMEALLRWKHPKRGLLEASQFMAVFEESGLAVTAGERVLEEACWPALRWPAQRPLTPPLVISVNLSAVQLERSDLARIGADVLGKTGLDPRRLSLDVTETAYIRILEERIATLDRLKELGVGVAIDDFGVGYSSLSYLKRLSADILKIDRSFVRGVGEVEEDTAIVRMVIGLAHTLGMKVVGEGIEEWEQAKLLAEMGCDMGQGFYFSRPLSPEAVPEFLAG
jgi:diguanylate cyclase (GGDEF)-like protein